MSEKKKSEPVKNYYKVGFIVVLIALIILSLLFISYTFSINNEINHVTIIDSDGDGYNDDILKGVL